MGRGAALILLALAAVLAAADPREDALLRLERGGVRVGILAGVGGRVVVLAPSGGENLLKAAPEAWAEPAGGRPPVGADTPWTAYYGHITWLAPQSRWWRDQTLNPARARGYPWPPDPWLVFAPYALVERDEAHVVLQGPVSQLSGIAVRKTVALGADGAVRVTVEARNHRDQPVTWGLWSVLRLPSTAAAEVPVADPAQVSLEELRDAEQGAWPVATAIADGRLRIHPEPVDPARGVRRRFTKAYVHRAAGRMQARCGAWVLAIGFEPTPDDQVAPGHAAVELFAEMHEDPARNVIEMEHHGPYRVLAPGEAMARWEEWRLAPAP